MIRKIMVATGGSSWSKNAVKYAARLAEFLRCELIVINVVEFPRFANEVLINNEFREKLVKASKKILDEAESIVSRYNVNYKLMQKKGSVAESIAIAAFENDVDLLIIGTRVKKRVLRENLGSLINKIAVMTPCPVLIVKEDKAIIEDLLKEGVIMR